LVTPQLAEDRAGGAEFVDFALANNICNGFAGFRLDHLRDRAIFRSASAPAASANPAVFRHVAHEKSSPATQIAETGGVIGGMPKDNR
jgi:hypothetical protein